LEAGNEVDDLCTEFSKAMEPLNLSLDPSELEDFVHIDDEDNEEYAIAVLEDVEEFLELMKIAETAMHDDGDVNTQELNVGLKNGVIFQGFDSFYKHVLDIEDEFKEKQRKHSMTSRNRLNHFRARSERSVSKPNDDSRHVQLINLETYIFCQKMRT
jgi:hypothetical protein